MRILKFNSKNNNMKAIESHILKIILCVRFLYIINSRSKIYCYFTSTSVWQLSDTVNQSLEVEITLVLTLLSLLSHFGSFIHPYTFFCTLTLLLIYLIK
jgi:hypothetical protein